LGRTRVEVERPRLAIEHRPRKLTGFARSHARPPQPGHEVAHVVVGDRSGQSIEVGARHEALPRVVDLQERDVGHA
jgi:hypothetical protein